MALERGGDVYAVDKNGETAMHGAAYKHVPSVARLLAAHGAKVQVWNRPNKKRWTPLRVTEGIPVGMNISRVVPPPTPCSLNCSRKPSTNRLKPQTSLKKFEFGRKPISNPKSEILNWTRAASPI